MKVLAKDLDNKELPFVIEFSREVWAYLYTAALIHRIWMDG